MRSILSLGFVAVLVLATACNNHKPVPIVDAAPPAVTPDTPTNLAPLTDDDAGEDAGNDAGPKKPGVFVDPKVARIKQCCGALRTQAKALGASPEAGLILGAAAQCDGIAAQAGAKGTAPELGFLRTIRTVPPICQGL
ncbi:MAG TPA: hypothetical protein VIF62_21465 [Labilithrix sp.]